MKKIILGLSALFIIIGGAYTYSSYKNEPAPSEPAQTTTTTLKTPSDQVTQSSSTTELEAIATLEKSTEEIILKERILGKENISKGSALEPYGAKKTVYPNSSGAVMKYSKSVGSEDSSVTYNFYYDNTQKLRLVKIDAGAVNGSKLEHRIYYNVSGKRISETHTYKTTETYFWPTIWPEESIVFDPLKDFSSSPNATFSHPTDEYAFSYDANKLEARASSETEFTNTGLQPSSVVTGVGGYMQEVEILTYRGTIDAAQESFIGAYRKYYSPQVLGTENMTINGNQARIVTYKVGPSYPEAKVYLIAYRPNEPRTIVAAGDYGVITTIKSQ